MAKVPIQVPSPGDCKWIASEIEKTTGKVISETTIKRFLGFARQEYSFSAFTLNTLSQFAGFDGWQHFCGNAISAGPLSEAILMWNHHRQKALSITKVTYKTIQNLSGVPFEYTISRRAKENDFNYFLQSKHQLFCLIGIPGMGKSVQIAWLLRKFFLCEDAPFKESIVLTVRPGILNSISPDFDLKETVEDPFGVSQGIDFLEYFCRHPEKVKGKIIMILDGFEDDVCPKSYIDIVFQKMMSILGCFRGLPWFKMVLSLRPDTWRLIKDKIDASDYLKETWFSGFFIKEN